MEVLFGRRGGDRPDDAVVISRQGMSSFGELEIVLQHQLLSFSFSIRFFFWGELLIELETDGGLCCVVALRQRGFPLSF